MDKKELVQWIRAAGQEDMQDLLEAVCYRYRELYPEWEIFFFSIEPGEQEARERNFRKVIEFAYKYGVKAPGVLSENSMKNL